MSKSNAEYVAEAVTAIPAWKAFLARKRSEVEAQVAQMQAAHGRIMTDTLPLVIPVTALLNEGDGMEVQPLPPEVPVIPATTNTDAPPAGEVMAKFEAALAEVDVPGLPMSVQDALRYRQSDPDRFARAMVAAQRRGQLPERLGYATARMRLADYYFEEAVTLYDSGQYPELFETIDTTDDSPTDEAPVPLSANGR